MAKKKDLKSARMLDKETLDLARSLMNRFEALKVEIGSLEVEKHGRLLEMDSLRRQFANLEKSLKEKYGEDSVVNMSTGEVTHAVDKQRND